MKRWFESKSIWLGVAAVVAAVAESLSHGLDYQAALLAGFGALAVVLRTVTSKELTK